MEHLRLAVEKHSGRHLAPWLWECVRMMVIMEIRLNSILDTRRTLRKCIAISEVLKLWYGTLDPPGAEKGEYGFRGGGYIIIWGIDHITCLGGTGRATFRLRRKTIVPVLFMDTVRLEHHHLMTCCSSLASMPSIPRPELPVHGLMHPGVCPMTMRPVEPMNRRSGSIPQHPISSNCHDPTVVLFFQGGSVSVYASARSSA